MKACQADGEGDRSGAAAQAARVPMACVQGICGY
jgi:hypothetical protein